MHNLTIIAVSTDSHDLLDRAQRVAPTEANLLISGETGTGKDLLARWIHEHSARKDGPYVKIDCGSLPESLLEAELFGYERGAFTGAGTSKPGRFEAAQGGTLVLDEVAGLTLPAQAKLLRVIEERRFTRLGGRQSVTIDARLISLSNVNLFDSVAHKTFRADLFHRLNVIPLEITPLRERPNDIPALVDYFLDNICRRHGKERCELSPDTLSCLRGYDLPGNARELFHILERAVLISREKQLLPNTLPPHLTSSTALMQRKDQKPTLAQLEAVYIREILTLTHGQKSRAAEILGISRKNLYEKMRTYGLPYNRKNQPEDGK
ncbi:MAG: sigma-54 dependent transcriptional regulator [Blastocatellia bacterium]|nr:sigma-54 dependent transcriptional regulator [Blastocatellia bacterium]